jgi:hypothetical protein
VKRGYGDSPPEQKEEEHVCGTLHGPGLFLYRTAPDLVGHTDAQAQGESRGAQRVFMLKGGTIALDDGLDHRPELLNE